VNSKKQRKELRDGRSKLTGGDWSLANPRHLEQVGSCRRAWKEGGETPGAMGKGSCIFSTTRKKKDIEKKKTERGGLQENGVLQNGGREIMGGGG